MKIRTKMIISVSFLGVALGIISASVIITNQQVLHLNKQMDLVRNIEITIGELRNQSYDYLLYQESQQKDLWESKFSSVSGNLSKLMMDKPEQRVLVRNIKSNQERLKGVFSSVVSTIENTSHNQHNTEETAFIRLLWSRIDNQTQRIGFDASHLSQMLRDQVVKVKQQNNMFIFVLMGAFVIFLFAGYLLIHRYILKSISNLRDGTKIIGSGNLDFTIEWKNDDEIGVLAQAINLMTMNLKTVTAAKEDLEKEILERKRAEEALQVKQEELTAVNEELQAQQEELYTTYQELQSQSEEIREHAEATARARDETEQRAAELDATISSIAAGVIIYDNLGNVIRINEFARNLLGYTSDDFNLPYQERPTSLKLRKSDGYPYAEEEAPLFRALRGEVIRNEEVMIAKDSEKPVWLSDTLAPIYGNKDNLIGVILIFTDITKQKRTAEDLLTSERELLKVTLNSLGEGVVALDKEERIIFINEAASKLTGFSQNEAIGEPVHKILYFLDDKTSEPIDKIPSQAVLNQSVLGTRDLREVTVSMNSSPIMANDGQSIGTVIVFQDITEKQKIEQELLKTAKLDSLGILAGGVAHDFNNILAGILANLQLASLKLKKQQDISKYLEGTIETTRKASGLTKQLLTFAKGGNPVKKSVSIPKMVKDAVQFALSGSNVKAEFHLPEDLWVVDVDEGQITQVINNLTINSDQAMPIGGILEIFGENVIFNTGSQYSPGQYVKLTVKDHGLGIPDEIINKIFDPFFTTKKTGNGLGLSTSYSIIKKHKGYLEVESAPGIGTTFFILLPASMGQLTFKESQKEIAASNEAKILLMDDDDIIRNVGGEMLTCFGYQVTLARDGQEAIDLYKKAKEAGETYDLVIMDLTVRGGLGGIETMAILCQIEPGIKAVISSGYVSDPVMSDYERYGFSGVVIKPYKFNELIEVLNKVIDKKLLLLD